MSAPAAAVTEPIQGAVDDLQRYLSERFQALQSASPQGMPAAGTAAGLAPIVVALGRTDMLEPANDPVATVRGAARVHLSGHGVLVGPWGDADACGHCLAIRWQRLRAEYIRESLEYGTAPRGMAGWPVLTGWVLDAVWALYQATVLAGSLDGRPRVSRLDPDTLQVHTFPLLPDPLCPSCGPGGSTPKARPVLAPTPKLATDAYRLHRASDFRLPGDALVNPVCGVLGPIATRQLTTPTTAPVFGSILMRGDGGLTDMTWSGQTNSYGESTHVGFLEGLERYAGTRRRSRAELVHAAYADIADRALDPRECGQYRPEVYEHDPRLRVFDASTEIPWVWGWSLRDERPILVPSRLVYYSAGSPTDNFVFECSNGCASGGSLVEAILFGLLELVERDAFLLGWYGGAQLPEIDVADSRDIGLRTMIDRADLRGYDVRVFDNRVDLDIPVVTSVARRRDGGDGTLAFAAAASLDPDEAVRSAVAEILTYTPELPVRVQARRAEIEAMADDFRRVEELRDHASLFALPRMARHAERYLRACTARPVGDVYRSWQDRRPASLDLVDDVRHCQRELSDAGFDVIVVDQTAPEQRALGLHTACTIVPGLLPIDFGWVRQRALRMPRMFTAYRRAGWRSDDLTPADLHRVPHPFP